MRYSKYTKLITACAIFASTSAAFSHVVLADEVALAGTSYRATFRVGHGCNGAPTTALRVTLPPGFRGAKPMPKAGWVLAIEVGRLSLPYVSHGKTITEDVTTIMWTAVGSDENRGLLDAHYGEFVLRGGLPAAPGPLWFKVLQSCEKDSIDWAQIPSEGRSTQGLTSPAALLEVIESGPSGHAH